MTKSMKRSHVTATLFLTAALAIPAHLAAQTPNGSDINQAIPIYFGQIVNDIGDSNTIKSKVYAITLAKGQQVSVTLTAPGKALTLTLHPPTSLTLVGCNYGCATGAVANSGNVNSAAAFTYNVATAGKYYVKASFGDTGTNYSLQVNAVGTPIVTPLPASVGCLTGPVDYLTYSLQLISAGLPDTASIGGTQLCATCTVKPPAYPEIVAKMETSMGLGASVSACYDSTGNIFQIKLIHP
jgi:hypothetical protein